MGADIYIKTKRKLPPKYDKYLCGEEYYFRDSYNLTNLAWVIKLSYWNDFVKNPVEFLKRLANISDEQIEKYVESKNLSNDEKNELIEILKSKRDYIKEIVKAGILNIEYSI